MRPLRTDRSRPARRAPLRAPSAAVLAAAIPAAILAAALAGCGAGGTCDAEALASELAAARAGDEVVVGECAVAGAFTVPSGVTLRGAGAGSILASAPGGAPVVSIAPGTGSRVASLAIEVGHGGLGVRAVSADSLELTDLRVRVERGVGVGLADLEGARVVSVELVGPLTEETAESAPLTSDRTGTFGLVARDAGTDAAPLALESVRARGFAIAAVSIERGVLEWIDRDDALDVSATRAVGVALFAARATIDGVELGDLFGTVVGPGIALAALPVEGAPSVAAIAGVTVSGGDGYGVFADGSELVLEGLAARDLGLAAVRVQEGTLVARDLVLERNGGAGVIAIDATSISIERATIRDHRETLLLAASGLTATFADGVHVVRASAGAPPIDLALGAVELAGNARAGLVVDAGDVAPARLALTDVRAEASGSAYGAVAQGAAIPAAWDTGVTREGAASINDASAPGTLDVVGIVMPPASMARAPSF